MPGPLTPNNEILDPVMGCTVPTGATPQGVYALDIQSAILQHITLHTHTGIGNLDGYQLGANALNIVSDLQLNNNNLGTVRSLELINNSSNLSGANDINCVYDVGGNLFFNDSLGNQIQLTENGAIVPSTIANLLNWSQNYFTGFGVPITVPNNFTYNVIGCSTNLNLTLPIILPLIATQTNGRFLMFVDISNTSSAYPITLSVSTGSTDIFSNGETSFTINSNSGYVAIYANSDVSPNTWQVYSQSVYNTNEYIQLNSGSALNCNIGSNINLTNAALTLNASSALTVNTGGSISITGNNITYLGNTISNTNTGLTDTGTTATYNTLDATYSTSSLLFTGGSVWTADTSTTFLFEGPMILGNTASPTPPLPLPTTPVLYVSNGEIDILTAGGVVSNIASGVESNTAGGITSLVAGGISSGVDGGFVLSGDGYDWVSFGTTRSKSLVVPIVPITTFITQNYGSPYAAFFNSSTIVSNTPGILTNTASNIDNVENVFHVALPITYNASTLSSATLLYKLGTTSTRSPSALNLGFAIYQASNTGAGSTILGSQYLTGGTNYGVAGAQMLTANIGTTVNNTTYAYYAVIQDESGTNAIGGNVFFNLTLNFTNITNHQLL